ncbi:hypothetical protein [Microvirgula curvata]
MIGLRMLGAGCLVAVLLGVWVMIDACWQLRCRPGPRRDAPACRACRQHDCPQRQD